MDFSEEDILRIKELASKGMPFIRIGIRYRVSNKKIRNIVTGNVNLKPRKRLYIMQKGVC